MDASGPEAPLKLTMTIMVRDEADVIGAMLRHHAAQGIDEFIITDNASSDGTTEIIQELATSLELPLTLLHDPEHRKQQGETVTRMARMAADRGATWVINADADEFWVARDPNLTLKQAFTHIEPRLGSFIVPVHDMTGPPAMDGSGLQRLVYRDARPVERMREVGIRAHATPDAVHVGDAEVVVAQGNHFVNIPSAGDPEPEWAVEVLHFPWRSWTQFAGKVERAGMAYERSPHLEPSANHHGMRDYRRLRDGTLMSAYVARHPDVSEIASALASGTLVEDRRIADVIESPVADTPFDAEVEAAQRLLWEQMVPLERRVAAVEAEARAARDDARGLRHEVEREREAHRGAEARADSLQTDLERAHEEIGALRARRVVRIADRLGRYLKVGSR